MAVLPLEGVRVIDVSQIWAGPHCTKLLANMGAEVIRIESIQRMDSFRGPAKAPKGSGNYPDGEPGERPYERAGSYNATNLGKLGITLNLANPKGKTLFRELVKLGDVVIENFSLGVMERLGLGYEVLKEIKPDIIMVSMPAFGRSGPEKNYVAYGITQEQLSGMVSLTGYIGGTPIKSGINQGDPITALHAAAAILAALRYRRKTGHGQFIEISHLETNICLIGEAIMGYTMNRRVQKPLGNRHPYMAPHGCYRCKGEDQWVTIAVASDEEWRKLCTAMRAPGLAEDVRFADGLNRWKNQDELDPIIEEWTRRYDHYEVQETLQAVGIAAGAVLDCKEVMENPHVVERGFFEFVTHPAAGTHLYPGLEIRLSKTPPRIKRPAPCLGQHNEEVLGGLLGLSTEELAKLAEEQVIGTVPLSAGAGSQNSTR